VSIELESDALCEVCTAFGERGVRAESVAESAARQAKEYLASGAPVGVHFADQWVLLVALAGGGSFRTLSPSLHTQTQLLLLPMFLKVRCDVTGETDGCVRIDVRPR
jgi:RNA 3'-terminal phosphate cyclase (ATP)